jgi:catechol 2,3-dioxygenase-like lactoylglutathione lyase family enzyme
LSRSRKFYEGILGLRFVTEDRFAAVFDAAGIMLRVAAVPDFQGAPFTILGWNVLTIGNTVRQLQSKSVSFERYNFLQQDDLGNWTSPSGARIAWFKDPDGNLFADTICRQALD